MFSQISCISIEIGFDNFDIYMNRWKSYQFFEAKNKQNRQRKIKLNKLLSICCKQ